MPAMSPTMEKGGVTEWKFAEGDRFSSGEVLLEVETDKSVIDVEAQDDGFVAKILVQNGTKDIPVGQPIAILGEEGDNPASLEIPDLSGGEAKKETPKEAVKETKVETKEAPKEVKESKPQPIGTSGPANSTQVFFPSVETLLSANGISREDAIAKIPATGPNGRLLQGDVLAYLGKIPKDAASSIAAFVNSHAKLDLTNIEKLAITPKETAKPEAKKESKPKKEVKKVEPIVKTFSLEKVAAFQSDALAKGVAPESLESYVEGASRRAAVYAYQTHTKKSDLYDPLFEEIVAPSARVERFTIRLDIPATVVKKVNKVSALDLAEDLFATPVSKAGAGELKVTVTVTLKKVADAKEKAELYLQRLEKYLSV